MEARWRDALADAERIARRAARGRSAPSPPATETAAGAERRAAPRPRRRCRRCASPKPPLSAALHRLNHARDALDQELARIAAARQEAGRRREQLAGDVAREDEHVADADVALQLLVEEQRALDRSEAGDTKAREAATAPHATAPPPGSYAAAEIGLQQMTEACAYGEAHRVALERRRGALADRRQRRRQRLDESEAQRRSLGEAAVPQAAIEAAAAELAAASAQTEADRAAAAAIAERLTAARADEAAAIDAAREAERRLGRLRRAEAEALASILAPAPASAAAGQPAMLTLLDVPAGLEAATAALFDDELAVPPLDSPADAANGWLTLPPLALSAALPVGAKPLADAIGAPPALARRLSQAGLVTSEAEGWNLQASLAAGQSLVDRDGRLWRWDGFVRTAPGDGGTAERLRQRNRLAAIAIEVAAAESEWQVCENGAGSARSRWAEAAAAEREAGATLRRGEETVAQKRAAETELARRALATEARLAALADAADKLAGELNEIEAQAAETERGLALLPDPALARAGLDGARGQAAAARRHESEAQAAITGFPAQETEDRGAGASRRSAPRANPGSSGASGRWPSARRSANGRRRSRRRSPRSPRGRRKSPTRSKGCANNLRQPRQRIAPRRMRWRSARQGCARRVTRGVRPSTGCRRRARRWHAARSAATRQARRSTGCARTFATGSPPCPRHSPSSPTATMKPPTRRSLTRGSTA